MIFFAGRGYHDDLQDFPSDLSSPRGKVQDNGAPNVFELQDYRFICHNFYNRSMPRKKEPNKKTKTPKPTEARDPRLSKHYFEVLLEDVNSKFQQLAESFTTLATKEDLRKLDARLERVESEQQIIKQILMEHSAILIEHSAKLDQKADKKDLEHLATNEDVAGIKTILANHEQRLLNLEN